MISAFSDFIAGLFLRDGIKTIFKIFRYGFSRRAWRWFFRNMKDKSLLRKTGILDVEWYCREYPEVLDKGLDPYQDFISIPNVLHRKPNPDFIPEEYSAMNFDVRASGIPPSLHYIRNGIRDGRPISSLENYEKPFPHDASEGRFEFSPSIIKNKRTAIFASFSSDGTVPNRVLYYLRGLREVVDNSNSFIKQQV